MRQRRRGLFRQAARYSLRSLRLGKLLRSELLEPRCALHGESLLVQELAPAIRPFPSGLNHADPLVRAAIAGITTSAPADQYAFLHQVAVGPALETKNAPGEALEQSGGLIGVPAFRSDPRFSGIDGTGHSVVFLDTGIDLDHPFFGPDTDGNQVADRILFNADFITGRPNADDTRGHGTHVSSIAASQDPVYSGVAPGSGIIHLRVLDDNGFGTAEAIESALQWVVANANAYNVASVNMSLSFGDNASSPTTRPDLGLSDELAALAAQGVITVSASGNSYFTYGGAPGVSYPSADPNSLSIGAVWDAVVQGPVEWPSGAQDITTGPDRLVSFSQRHPTLTTVFAPGAQITAAAIGGGVSARSGTSMAAPHIAGMAAVMQQLAVQTTGERLSVPQFTELLSATGLPIFDGDDEDDNVANTGLEFRRVDMVAMANAIVSGGLSDLALAGEIGTRSSTAPAGGRMRLDFVTANQGLASTGVFAGNIYLSTDEVIDGSDILLGSFEESLSAGQSSRRSGYTVDLPSSVAAGNYFLGVMLDGQSVVQEANEQNNAASIPISVTAPAPDVWLQDLSSGSELQGGQTIDFGQTLSGGADVVKRFKIYNDGATALAMSALTVPAGFSVASFPATVAPLESVEFEVSLLASSGDAQYAGDIAFTTDDPDTTSFAFNVAGTVDLGATAETAGLIPPNTTVSAAIATAGDADWFRFDAMSGVEYQIETTLGTLLDSVVRIRDAAGIELAVNDDSPTGLNSKLAWTPTSDGAYYIEASGKSTTGTYELSLAAGDDHGDDAATATSTTDPSVNFGGIEAAGDVDWFAFDASAGTDYLFEAVVSTLPAASLRLFDASGVELATASSGAATTLIEWRAPSNGTFHLAVAGASPSMVGAYQLLITGADDHGDNAPNATLVSTPGAAPGVIEERPDVDWFAFDAVGGARYEFSTEVTGRSDTLLRLIDRNGAVELARDDNSGVGLGSLLQWTAPESGRYFIEISGLAGVGQHHGAYVLGASIQDDHGDDAPGATPTNDPSNNAGVIESATDADWFVFEATAGVTYRAEQTAGALSQAVLSVIGPDGQPVPTTGAGTAPLEWTAASSGPFYIVVEAASGAQLGDYVVRLTGEDDHGDNVANATALIVPGNLAGVLQGLDDHDWFSFESVVGLEYRFETTLDAPAVIRLYERDGATLVAEARGDSGAPAVLNWTPTENGDFYLELAQEAAAPAAETLPVAVNYGLRSFVTGRAPGDYVDDLFVDGHDFLLWQQSVSSTTDLRADGNNDGVVDGADLAIWAERFGPVFGDRGIASSASAPALEAHALAEPSQPLVLVQALPQLTAPTVEDETESRLLDVSQRSTRAEPLIEARDQAMAAWRWHDRLADLLNEAESLRRLQKVAVRGQEIDRIQPGRDWQNDALAELFARLSE